MSQSKSRRDVIKMSLGVLVGLPAISALNACTQCSKPSESSSSPANAPTAGAAEATPAAAGGTSGSGGEALTHGKRPQLQTRQSKRRCKSPAREKRRCLRESELCKLHFL